MHFLLSPLALGLALIAGVRGAPRVDGPLSTRDQEVIFPTWVFNAIPNGPVIEYTGTVQGLYSYVNDNYPQHLGAVFNLDVLEQENESSSEENFSIIEKRTDFSQASHKCTVPINERPTRKSAQNGINYLRSVKGRPVNDPGKCGRVSCAWNAGISWCNNDSKYKTLNSFGSIADGAQHVLNKCPGSSVAGSATHPTRWTVKVTFERC
ncbi:hypothetical protein ACJ41O_015344 [Fusarium nematophilum]